MDYGRIGITGSSLLGGRYDGLVEKLGGRATPAIGWAMGIERLVALYEACGGQTPASHTDVYIAALGDGTLERAFALAEELRDRITGIRVEVNLGGGSFKSQMKRADKSAAEFALILGEQELADSCIGIKPLRSTDEQTSVALDELAATLAKKLR